MSHHLEVMAIAAERDAVLQAMLDLGLSLKRLDEYDEYDDMVPDLGGSGREIIIGLSESKGATYLWGGTPELTSDLDLLRELSRKINVRTAAGHVHTASGMFFLAMAIDGQLKRLYAACYMARQDRVEMGAPLPIEGHVPLDREDGEGIITALTSLGFDIETAMTDGLFRTLICDSSGKMYSKSKEAMTLERFYGAGLLA